MSTDTRPTASPGASGAAAGGFDGWYRHGPLAALRGLLDRPLASYYLLVASASLLLTLGLVMVFSATSVEGYAENGNAYASVAKQALFALFGIVAFWIFQRLPVRTYRALGFPLLALSGALLVLLDLLAVVAALRGKASASVGPVHGDGMWLYFGSFQLEPSEMAKLGLALWGALVLATRGEQIRRWRRLAYPLFPVAAVTLLLVGVNDLGTMLCILILFTGMLWGAGVRLRVFGAMCTLAIVGVGLLVALPGKAGYRAARLTDFVNPSAACANGGCYQALEGRYALADGGWFGVGLGEGKLKWGWLPNGRNDFIFAVIGEELGVVGCFVVLALFAVLAYTGLRIARRVEDPFRSLVATGITMWLAGQATINIGGVVGLLPITGVPLPFISDGGTALVVVLAAIGLLASFARAEPDAARALHARPPSRWVRLLWAPLPPLPRGGASGRGARAPRPAPVRPRPPGAGPAGGAGSSGRSARASDQRGNPVGRGTGSAGRGDGPVGRGAGTAGRGGGVAARGAGTAGRGGGAAVRGAGGRNGYQPRGGPRDGRTGTERRS